MTETLTHLAASATRSTSVLYRAWVSARQALLEAQAGGSHLATLFGPPGIGKTFLLAELERHFRQSGYEVERFGHGDLLTGEETAHILLVDEADRMEEEALRRLAARQEGFVVLAALPGFARRMEGLVHATIRLAPLEPDEIGGYLGARLSAMGLPKDRFAAETLPVLATASGGVPRLLNTLIGSSAFTADMEGEVRVTARHVDAAAALRAEVALPPDAASSLPHKATQGPKLRRESHALEVIPPPSAPAPKAPTWRRRLPWLGGGGAAILLLAAGATWVRQGSMPPAEAPLIGAPGSLQVVTEAPPPQPATAATPPARATALPGLPLPRVVLTYPRRDTAAADRGTALATTLASSGWLVGNPFPVARASTAPALRYFFHDDREAALALAELAGGEAGPPQLGNLAAGAPLPRPGTLELALPTAMGSATPEAARAEAKPRQPPPPAAATVQPADRSSVIAAGRLPAEVVLRWSVPGGATAGCCYVEVVALPNPGEAAAMPRETFAGYGQQPDSQPVLLAEARSYAWRVITISREGLRYASGPWAVFRLQGGAE